jgi:hypothetical protein
MIEIVKILLMSGGQGCDTVLLHTKLPPSVYPWTENPSLKFEVAKGKGRDYARDNFPGIELEEIKLSKDE